jgi:hypothetical protein
MIFPENRHALFGIVLIHDGVTETGSALPAIVIGSADTIYPMQRDAASGRRFAGGRISWSGTIRQEE